MYEELYMPNHARARVNGMVRKHILVAEELLGRPLRDGECVHHINENKSDNSPDNLMIFHTNSDHIRYHRNKERDIILNQTPEGIFSCQLITKKCLHCGKETENKKYCSAECFSMAQRTVTRPNKEELKQLLIKHNFTKVGKLFNVSDNAIRKWCKNYGMSTKAKDYK